MVAGSRAANIHHSVSIHSNCSRSALAERYNSANIGRLAQPIDHSCRYHDVHNSYLIDVARAVRHCGNYYYSLAAAPAHDWVDRAMAETACVVDIFGLGEVVLDRIGRV